MYSKILLAIDGSEHATKAAQFVHDLLKLNPSAKATLVYVEEIHREYHIYRTIEIEVPINEENIIDKAKKLILDKVGMIFADTGSNVESKVIFGSPAEKIVEEANNGGYDLIVTGSRGMNPIEGFFVGSVSDRVMHMARCAVLVVK